MEVDIMIQYFDDYDLACVDGLSFRRDKKKGYYLSSKKIGKTRKRLHVYMWEKANGKVPKGYHIHHIDEDKRNNELSNLRLIEGREHVKQHGAHLTPEQIEARKANLINNAVPKSKAWHASAEGIEWHRKHGIEAYAKRNETEYTCTQCGKRFLSKRVYSDGENRFCSNACKAAYRRDSGVDDVEKKCERCGKTYVANKYQKTKYCPRCLGDLGYPRKRIQHDCG